MESESIIEKAQQLGIDPTVDSNGNPSDGSEESMLGNVAEKLGFDRDNYDVNDLANRLSELGGENQDAPEQGGTPQSAAKDEALSNTPSPSQPYGVGYSGSRFREASDESGGSAPGIIHGGGTMGPIKNLYGVVNPYEEEESEEDSKPQSDGQAADEDNNEGPEESVKGKKRTREEDEQQDYDDQPNGEKIDNSQKHDDKKLNMKRVRLIAGLIMKILIFLSPLLMIALILGIIINNDGGKAKTTERRTTTTVVSPQPGPTPQPGPSPAPSGVLETGYCSGSFVTYHQCDYSDSYGDSDMCHSGCGPTSAAMLLTYYLGRSISPVEVARYAESNNMYLSQSLYVSVGNSYGLNVVETSPTRENIIKAMEDCTYVVISVGRDIPNSYFARSALGHLIVLHGVNDNNEILIADAGQKHDGEWVSVDKIVSEADNMWRFSR